MSENTVFVRCWQPEDERLAADRREILRYAGCPAGEADEELLRLLDETMTELDGAFSYRVCLRRMALTWRGETPELPFSSESKSLAKCLRGCNEIIMFGATVGIEVDRFIARYQHISPAKALLAQAYGAERVECLCDVFCDEMRNEAAGEGLRCTPRFSPGYGDLPLEVQSELFRLLDCTRRIGVSLGGSLLMTPSKSVTAVFGLAPQEIK